jgi:hypothetical protein
MASGEYYATATNPYATTTLPINPYGTSQNITWTFDSATTSQPFVALPVVASPAPVDDSPLGWLRAQVAEIIELASAA